MQRRVVEVRNTTRGQVPRLPFEYIARRILPKHYQLSLVLCGDSLARKINKKHRNKTYAANVLSFPLDTSEGEIFLDVRKAAREARRFKVTFNERIALLFIHGCLHLKGAKHGATMEHTEQKILRSLRIAQK